MSGFCSTPSDVKSVVVLFDNSLSAMYGLESNLQGVDLQASETAFCWQVIAALEKHFPNALFAVQPSRTNNPSISIDNYPFGDNVEAAKALVGEVWESFEWLCESIEPFEQCPHCGRPSPTCATVQSNGKFDCKTYS